MNVGDIRLANAATPLGPSRASSGPSPEALEPQPVADQAVLGPASSPSPAAETAPPQIPKAYFNISMRLPASLVSGLAGYTLALVPDQEVKEGKWQPEGGARHPVSVPQVLFADLASAPEAGKEHILALECYVPEVFGLQSPDQSPENGFYLTSRGELSTGRTLEQALKEARLPAGQEGVLNVAVGLAPNQASELANSVIALIPTAELQNGQWVAGANSSAPAPQVERALSPPLETFGGIMVHTPVTGSTAELDDPIQQHALAGATSGVMLQRGLDPEVRAVLDRAMKLDWVANTLEQHKIHPEHAKDVVSHYSKMDQAGLSIAADLSTEQGRKDVATASFLAYASLFQNTYEKHGHEATERVKVALANNRPEQILEENGQPFLAAADLQLMTLGVSAKLGKLDPFRDVANIRAAEGNTRIETVATLQQYLNVQPQPESDLAYFNAAVHRHQNPPAGIVTHNTLGSMKEVSDKTLEGLDSRRTQFRWVNVGVGALITVGAVATGFYPLLALGVPQLIGARSLDKSVGSLVETEQRINRVIGDMIHASSQEGGEAALIQHILAKSKKEG